MDTDALRDPALRDPTLRDPALRDPALRDPALREPTRLPERATTPAVPEQRLGGAAALARITTLQPRSYNEARTIGERYRDGVPVIMNLTELDDAAAKRLARVLDELQRVLLRIRVKSPRGHDAVLVAPIIAQRIEELDDDARSVVFWRFSEPMRRVMQASDHYAEMQRQAVLAFESRYSVTLYEHGCLLYRRQHPTWQGSMVELRELLGVPAGTYRDWTDLSRFTLGIAKSEIDHIAPFTLSWRESRRGRAVVGVELRFEPKEPEAAAAAKAELNSARTGRKTRRDEQAKVQAASTRQQLDLVEAVNALRADRALLKAAK